MPPLFLLLLVAAGAFVTVSLAAMAALLVARLFRERVGAREARMRSATRGVFLEAMRGGPQMAAALAPLRPRPALVAEALLEIASLVRGSERERMLDALLENGFLNCLLSAAVQGRSRQLCVEAIGVFPRTAAEPTLRLLLKDRDGAIRLAAAAGLLAIEAPLSVSAVLDMTPISDGHSGLMGELVRRVVCSDPAGGQAALSRSDLSPLTRALLLDSLGTGGDYSSISILLSHVDFPEVTVRAAAVLSLGRLMHPKGREAIALALDDPHWCVRAAACHAIGLGSFDTLLGPLAARLSDSVWSVRRQAAEAMKAMGAVGRLQLEGVSREAADPAVRELALCALFEAQAA